MKKINSHEVKVRVLKIIELEEITKKYISNELFFDTDKQLYVAILNESKWYVDGSGLISGKGILTDNNKFVDISIILDFMRMNCKELDEKEIKKELNPIAIKKLFD